MPLFLENWGGSARGPVGLGRTADLGALTTLREACPWMGRPTGVKSSPRRCLDGGFCTATTGANVRARTKPMTPNCVITSKSTAAISHTVFFEVCAMIFVELDDRSASFFKTEANRQRSQLLRQRSAQFITRAV